MKTIQVIFICFVYFHVFLIIYQRMQQLMAFFFIIHIIHLLLVYFPPTMGIIITKVLMQSTKYKSDDTKSITLLQ